MIAVRKGRVYKVIKYLVFVCVYLATRAVHLEFISDLMRDAFFATMIRFIARMGKSFMYSVSTTFLGAFNELDQLLSQDLLGTVDPDINLFFISCSIPLFGGTYLTNITFEEMATCLIRVKAILISRSLTPSIFIPISPAYFLIGRSLVMLPHSQIPKMSTSAAFNAFAASYSLSSIWFQSSVYLNEDLLVIIWLLGLIVHMLTGEMASRESPMTARLKTSFVVFLTGYVSYLRPMLWRHFNRGSMLMRAYLLASTLYLRTAARAVRGLNDIPPASRSFTSDAPAHHSP